MALRACKHGAVCRRGEALIIIDRSLEALDSEAEGIGKDLFIPMTGRTVDLG